MSIAQTVLALSKLRQERHGDERLKQRRGRALSSEHAAPDEAWVVFDGSSSINTALLTELSRSLIPLRTARSRNPAGSSGAPIAPSSRTPTDEANRCNLRHVTPKTLQKALYVRFSQIGRPLQVVCLGGPNFQSQKRASQGRPDQPTVYMEVRSSPRPSSRKAALVSSSFCLEMPPSGATSKLNFSFSPLAVANLDRTLV